ncbi:uncharacterized protein LOC110168507 [Boleophthalmus pectinirostris]|uniref:uncharacterized protein LOC110168507 n=1 Tax=Boleophthalmus pectinirostris TaxID=150288 RepID=UPI00242BB220|nr:uncharacterized protein LOC110168507 [Boleophthalmus pectinirostris]
MCLEMVIVGKKTLDKNANEDVTFKSSSVGPIPARTMSQGTALFSCGLMECRWPDAALPCSSVQPKPDFGSSLDRLWSRPLEAGPGHCTSLSSLLQDLSLSTAPPWPLVWDRTLLHGAPWPLVRDRTLLHGAPWPLVRDRTLLHGAPQQTPVPLSLLLRRSGPDKLASTGLSSLDLGGEEEKVSQRRKRPKNFHFLRFNLPVHPSQLQRRPRLPGDPGRSPAPGRAFALALALGLALAPRLPALQPGDGETRRGRIRPGAALEPVPPLRAERDEGRGEEEEAGRSAEALARPRKDDAEAS